VKFWTFDELTELGFSWSAPTLLLGMTMETAATLVPASATSSAAQAITIDGVGLNFRKEFMCETSSFTGLSVAGYRCLFAADQSFTSL